MTINTVKLQENGYLINGTTSVPNGYSGWMKEALDEWLQTNTPEPICTEEELQAKAESEARVAKQQALDTITVTTSSGKVFDGRDKDRARMNEALTASGILGATETQWKLADNTVATIALDELKEALALSIQAVGNIVVGEN